MPGVQDGFYPDFPEVLDKEEAIEGVKGTSQKVSAEGESEMKDMGS